MEKKDIRGLSHEELVDYLKRIDEKPFRATQIFEWLYKKEARDFDSMTNLSAALKDQLRNNFLFNPASAIKKDIARDGTAKLLFELHDGQRVETVFIPASTHATVCISTQVGCKFHCNFCASGLNGWSRDLSCAEIISQILYVKNYFQKSHLSHIVFMGVGEPLDNYDNLIKAIRIINSSKGVNIAARRITVSTCGLIPKIKQLAKEGMQIELSVSLHGSNSRAREILMPVNKKYPLEELIGTCKNYIQATNRQITFEYVLIRDLTCTKEAALELKKLLKGMICKLNLIPYNKVEGFDYEPPNKIEMLTFKQRLSEFGIHSTVRMPRGRDVNAACGQLRYKFSTKR